MRTVMVAFLSLCLAISSFAQAPAGATVKVHRAKKPLIYATVESFATCGIALGFSSNPAGAAAIGIPILAGGTIVSWKIYQNHPKLATFIQSVSGLGCLARVGYHRKPTHITGDPTPGKPPINTPPATTPPSDPPVTTPPTTPPVTPPVTPPTTVPPTTPPVTPPTTPPVTPPPITPPPVTHGCIQDCGFPGNGGVNTGHDIKKPPFPGKGRN